jgi:hypothetical protein
MSATVTEAVYHAAVEDDAVDYRRPWSVPRVTRADRLKDQRNSGASGLRLHEPPVHFESQA